MSKQKAAMSYSVALFWLGFAAPASAGLITDFQTWKQVEDPPHVNMTGGVVSSTEVSLTAIGPVPAGTDIGYQSINGNTVAGSSSGNYFLASQDFHIAVDFAVDAGNSTGFAAIGFGIGEDGDGNNSAGPLLAFFDGTPLGFFGGARTNNVDITPLPVPFGPSATTSGRFFLDYQSLSGNITIGVNTIPGSNLPTDTITFGALQTNWNNDSLLVSFFLRSDELIFPPLINYPILTSGEVDVAFSNFEVLTGTPISAVPLPAAVWLFGGALGGLLTFRGRSKTTG